MPCKRDFPTLNMDDFIEVSEHLALFYQHPVLGVLNVATSSGENVNVRKPT